MIAKNSDLYEPTEGEGPPGFPRPNQGMEKQCPGCKGRNYAVCAAASCGFSLCFDCKYTAHEEKAFARHH